MAKASLYSDALFFSKVENKNLILYNCRCLVPYAGFSINSLPIFQVPALLRRVRRRCNR